MTSVADRHSTRLLEPPKAILRRHAPAGHRSSWQSRYRHTLFLVDLCAVLMGIVLAGHGWLDPFPGAAPEQDQLFTAAFVALWFVLIALNGGYDGRFLGTGTEEFRRVAKAAIHLSALTGTGAFVAQHAQGRGLIVIGIPAAGVLALMGRCVARSALRRLRQSGHGLHRVVILGSGSTAHHLVTRLRAAPDAGYQVLGICTPEVGPGRSDDPTAPIMGSLQDLAVTVAELHADTVAVAHSPEITAEVLRRVAWELEDSDVQLVVAPPLTDVAGPRIHIRPVSGLPLLHVEKPCFRGPTRLAKGAVDRATALLALIVLAPALLLLCLAIRWESPGAPVFKQKRVGRNGSTFTLYKLRTMRSDAEERLVELIDLNESPASVLFKIRQDPRVTRLGKLLRRYSLDELPQLYNVLRGDMSLVGPRPPLPVEVAKYDGDTRRRLLVKPGLTGLWQVSGRSDLSWPESVRLDLYYVENWSPALDMMIVWKTTSAILKGRGAY